MKPYVVLGVRNLTFLEMYAVLDSYLYSIQGTACQIKKAFYHAEGFPAHLCHHIEDRKN